MGIDPVVGAQTPSEFRVGSRNVGSEFGRGISDQPGMCSSTRYTGDSYSCDHQLASSCPSITVDLPFLSFLAFLQERPKASRGMN